MIVSATTVTQMSNFGHEAVDPSRTFASSIRMSAQSSPPVSDRSMQSTCPRIRLMRATSFCFSLSMCDRIFGLKAQVSRAGEQETPIHRNPHYVWGIGAIPKVFGAA
jgi:hypothetical protein